MVLPVVNVPLAPLIVVLLAAVPLNLKAIKPEDLQFRPEIFSGLKHLKHLGLEVQTGNLCSSDRKSVQADRKSTASRPENFSGKPSEEPLLKTLKEEPSDARARESRDVAPSPARETSIGDRKEPESVSDEEKLNARRAELKEQARILLLNSGSKVLAEPGKYAVIKP